MKNKSDEIKQLELAYGLLICPAASGYQAFKLGCYSIGRGESPEQAAQDWKAKRFSKYVEVMDSRAALAKARGMKGGE